MKYILLIYGDEARGAALSQEEVQAEMAQFGEFNAKVNALGVLVSGDGLHPTRTATTIKVRDGKTLTTDGPFAETREQLGGYYVLDCENLDQAIELAAQIPGALTGSVEIRPMMEIEIRR